jgi:pimeloyl-ACP methyl ester carboxylesterase
MKQRLAALLPHATVVPIPDSYTFVPEDQPARLARLVIDFARTPATPATPATHATA